MALSRTKAGSLIGTVISALDLSQEAFTPYERLPTLNGVVRQVAQHFYPLLAKLYLTPTVMAPARSGKFSSGSGTYTPSSQQIEITMSFSMTIGDLEKMVTFWDDSNYAYLGVVDQVVSATKFIVRGDGFPTVATTILGATVVGGAPTNSIINLNSLPVMWGHGNIDIDLESSVTDYCEPVSISQLKMWDNNAYGNRNKIVWTLTGCFILFKAGSALVNPGTLVVRYPRLPELLLSPTQDVDLPEGVFMELTKLLLMQRLQARMRDNKKDYRQEIQSTIAEIYQSFGIAREERELKNEINSLI